MAPLPAYRTVKPHAADTLDCCTPRGPGHYACQNPGCTGAGENNGAGRAGSGRQVRRHATAAEYAALPVGLIPIDGVCHRPVFMCDDCADDLGEFCEHPPTPALPCPKCRAEGDEPCLKKDGKTPRGGWHVGRQRPSTEACRHAHREDCAIFDGCVCSADDTPPVRPKRTVVTGPEPDTSRLLIPVDAARVLLATRGIPWALVREVASVWTQDNKPAIRAMVARADDTGHPIRDEHGHETLDEVVTVIEQPPGTP